MTSMASDVSPTSIFSMVLAQYSSNGSRPSFYEIIMLKAIEDSIFPAWEHFVHSLARAWDLSVLETFSSESYAIFMAAANAHMLWTSDAGLLESMNSLRRISVSATADSPRRLNSRDRWVSLMMLSVFPYLKHKLHVNYRSLASSSSSFSRTRDARQDMSGTNWVQRWQVRLAQLFLAVYPAWHVTHDVALFLYRYLYLLQLVPCHSPLLHLARLGLRRVTAEDLAGQASTIGEAEWSNESFVARLGLLQVYHHVNRHGKVAVVTMALLFKFVEWWYSDANSKNRTSQVSRVPPPPAPAKPSPGGVTLPANPSMCPLCLRRRTNNAASSAGFVACYPCLHRYVTLHSRCPISGLPCTLDQIRRIF